MKRAFGILMMITFLALTAVASVAMVKPSHAQTAPIGSAVSYEIDPPVIVLDQTPDQQFNVTIALNNCTTDNVPAGLSGTEVHVMWDNTTFQAVSFTSYVGQVGGPLSSGPLFGISPGFYEDAGGTVVAPSPYADATHFVVAAAATNGWNGNESTVAVITLQTIGTMTPGTSSAIGFDSTDLKDINNGTPNYSVSNATVYAPLSYDVTYNSQTYTGSIISDSNPTTPTFDNVTNNLNFTVTTPSNGTLPGFANVTIPMPIMWYDQNTNWEVSINGNTSTPFVNASDSSNTYLWFTIPPGNDTVSAIAIPITITPEFPMTSLLLVLTGTMLVGAAIITRFRKKLTIR